MSEARRCFVATAAATTTTTMEANTATLMGEEAALLWWTSSTIKLGVGGGVALGCTCPVESRVHTSTPIHGLRGPSTTIGLLRLMECLLLWVVKVMLVVVLLLLLLLCLLLELTLLFPTSLILLIRQVPRVLHPLKVLA